MAAYLADSSVLLDVLTADHAWAEWSVQRLEKALADGTVFIDPIVYAEISVGFSRIEELETSIEESGLVWSELPREALFLAGKAFMKYRKSGEPKTAPLPDFLIGAHAAVSNLVLITRDPRRIRAHYPTVRLSCPP
ncbi:MAG: type II toxin-antitoxin system VapC family toxin [Spirochaetia bacterium]